MGQRVVSFLRLLPGHNRLRPPPRPLVLRRVAAIDDDTVGLRGSNQGTRLGRSGLGGRPLPRSREALRRARQAGEHFRRDFQDMPYWEDLDRQRRVKRPQRHLPASQGRMLAWLRKLGIDHRDYLAWSGEKSLREFPQT